MPRKRKHRELHESDFAALSLSADSAREAAARRIAVPRSSHNALTQASSPAVTPEELAQQPQQALNLPLRPAVTPPNKPRKLVKIIAAAPGRDRGVVACLDRRFHIKYRDTFGRWLTTEPLTWGQQYLLALSRAAYFAKPAELNERLGRQLDTKQLSWMGLTAGDVFKVVDEMRAEENATTQAQDTEGNDEEEDHDAEEMSGWNASLAFR